MAIRITGLNSGLDTESLVSALVSAYRKKSEKYTKAQTKLSWKQEAWSSLNTKINSFYKSLDALRFTSGYTTKKVNVSDSTKAAITATNGAVNGTQTLEVNEVAKAGYLTGASLGSGVKGSTKLSELDGLSDDLKQKLANGEKATISVTVKGKTTDISVDSNTTMDSFAESLKNAGIKASFDSTNHRFFISAASAGKANDFSLTAGNTNGLGALQALGLSTSSTANTANYEKYAAYAKDSNGNDYYKKDAKGNLVKDTNGKLVVNDDVAAGTALYDAAKTEANITSIRGNLTQYANSNVTLANDIAYANAYKNVEDTKKEFTADEWEQFTTLLNRSDTSKIYVADNDGGTTYKINDDGTATRTLADGTESTVNVTKNGDKYELDDGTVLKNGAVRLAELEVKGGLATEKIADDGSKSYVVNGTLVNNLKRDLSTVDKYEGDAATKQAVKDAYDADNDGDGKPDGEVGSLLEGWQNQLDTQKAYIANHALLNSDKSDDAAFTEKIGISLNMLQDPSAYESEGAVRVNGTDAVITLNGAQFTSADNTFEINGLSINALAKTDGEISITTENDVSGLYDKIKDFLTSYNTLINEMTSLYNAGSSSGYEPLTDEEREAMSDTEIEKWETKIKDSLLRRDNTLSSIMSLMTTSMSKAYNVNGKNVSLASFGIATLGIFDAATNQQNAYHIYGDEDDASTASKDDKLMAALKNDPDSVIQFMTQLTDGLYKAIDKKMGSSTLSSKYVVYNDKEMAREYSDYTDTITKWEDKLAAKEEYYYKKFSAMETALAKLQAQQSQLSGLLGM